MSMVAPSGVVPEQVVAVHAGVTVPAHAPWAVQASPVVQAMPSSQDVPAATGLCVQPVPAMQVSVVQGSPSSQLGAEPPEHTPVWQVCPIRQGLDPQAVPLVTGVWTQAPPTTLSVVQGFWSSQLGVKQVACPLTTMHAWFCAAQGFGVQGSLVQPPIPSS
jgi:hypothetical protein